MTRVSLWVYVLDGRVMNKVSIQYPQIASSAPAVFKTEAAARKVQAHYEKHRPGCQLHEMTLHLGS